jgi:hypothetical protein
MKKNPTNIGSSVRHRLLDLSRERGDDFNLILTRYVLERLLYRLSVSRYRQQFILKGAMLFLIWGKEPHRPTRDLDLHGSGSSSIDSLVKIFKDRRNQLMPQDISLADVASFLREFLMPPAMAVANNETFKLSWQQKGSWQ